jgi:hypothetical protein
LFQAFVEEMRALIEEEPDSLERSSLKEAVPLIQQELCGMREEMKWVRKVSEKTYEKSNDTHKKVEGMEKLVGETREGLAAGLMTMASNLGGRTTATATTSPGEARQDTGAEDETEDDIDWGRAKDHKIQITAPATIRTIYDEYKGLGRFRGMPIEGGLEGCDAKYKTKWRKGFSASDQKRFSRMKMLATGIEGKVREGRELHDVIADWDQHYQTGGRSFGGLITLLQNQGCVGTKGSRVSRKRSREQSLGVGGGGGQSILN